METFANALIVSSYDFLAQKNLWLENATLAAEEITKQVQAARETAYASPSVKKAEAELEAVVKQNEAEIAAQQKAREEYQHKFLLWQQQRHPGRAYYASGGPPPPPDGRAMYHAQMERLRKATEAVNVTKAAALETESFKKLCEEHASIHAILSEARRSRAEAESFVKIFGAICQKSLESLSKKTA